MKDYKTRLMLVILLGGTFILDSCQNNYTNSMELESQDDIESYQKTDTNKNLNTIDTNEIFMDTFETEQYINKIEELDDIKKFRQKTDPEKLSIKLNERYIDSTIFYSIQYGGEDEFRFYSSYTFLVSQNKELYYYWTIQDSLVMFSDIDNNQLPR